VFLDSFCHPSTVPADHKWQTRAKAVLMRDLEKLQVARMPIPSPRPVAPPAPMMDMPSTLAHTMSLTPGFPPKEETKRAPFPDMGMGLSDDVVVDLTAGDKKPTASPLIPAGTLQPVASGLSTPPIKQSPKPGPPAKVTPVPLPQIPPQLSAAAQRATTPQQLPPVVQLPQDNSMESMINLTTTGGAPAADMIGGELNFTNMEFTLAPSSDGPSQNAPPAPMQDFDISSFTAQDGGNDLLSMDDFTNAGSDAVNITVPTPTPAKAPENFAATGTNVDSMYDLGNIGSGGGVDNMDLDLDLGGGSGANDNTFDDLFFDTNDADDMGQFDNAYFGLE
jgi:hypothetical protein